MNLTDQEFQLLLIRIKHDFSGKNDNSWNKHNAVQRIEMSASHLNARQLDYLMTELLEPAMTNGNEEEIPYAMKAACKILPHMSEESKGAHTNFASLYVQNMKHKNPKIRFLALKSAAELVPHLSSEDAGIIIKNIIKSTEDTEIAGVTLFNKNEEAVCQSAHKSLREIGSDLTGLETVLNVLSKNEEAGPLALTSKGRENLLLSLEEIANRQGQTITRKNSFRLTAV